MKKRAIWGCVIANLLGIALIPVNLFLLRMPACATIISAALMLAALVRAF